VRVYSSTIITRNNQRSNFNANKISRTFIDLKIKEIVEYYCRKLSLYYRRKNGEITVNKNSILIGNRSRMNWAQPEKPEIFLKENFTFFQIRWTFTEKNISSNLILSILKSFGKIFLYIKNPESICNLYLS